MSKFRSIADIRRDYGELSLDENTLLVDPFQQFQLWFEEVLQNEMADPTAMVLSTVDQAGHPDSRVVLLKGIEEQHFLFYTNYQSGKAQQIEHHSFVALNFYWPQMARQVRVRGIAKRVRDEQSDSYFASRPVKSQLSAIASPQSHAIPDRQFLHSALNDLIAKHQQEPVLRPKFWGGYAVLPEEFEFWQGRDNRLHDRIRYSRQEGQWQFHRLAP